MNKPPAEWGCPDVTATLESLVWNKSTSSLDCFGKDNGKPGCRSKEDPSLWYEPTNQQDCEKDGHLWVPDLCGDNVGGQPWGYGPANTLKLNWGPDGGKNCTASYQLKSDRQIGAGPVALCSDNKNLEVHFYGDNEKDDSELRLFLYKGAGYGYECKNGNKVGFSAEGLFALHCEFDSYDNTTCTAGPLNMPIWIWYKL